MTNQNKRTPKTFDPKDPEIKEQAKAEEKRRAAAIEKDINLDLNVAPHPEHLSKKLFSWGTLLLASALGLLALALSATIVQSIGNLISEPGLISRLALTLIGLALLSAIILILKDLIAVSKLAKLANLKEKGGKCHSENKLKPSRKYAATISNLYKSSNHLSWQIARLKTHENTIMDGSELIELVDKELGSELDKEAKKIITLSARKVSLITALAPGPLIDMAAVAFMNIRMIRKIAEIYGVNPGLLGSFKLTRKVLAHLALTGGISLTSDLLSPLIGSSIAAKLSRRLGEGIFNGGLTIRIGLSTMEIARPIPYVSTEKPSFKSIAVNALSKTAKSNK